MGLGGGAEEVARPELRSVGRPGAPALTVSGPAPHTPRRCVISSASGAPMRRQWFCLFAVVAVAAVGAAARGEFDGRPVEPFRIAGTVHYVGTTELGSYLVSTGAGHIVIDGGYESTAPAIVASI